MPDPESVQISTDKEKTLLFLPRGSNIDVTLTCTVMLLPTVNIPVTVKTKWTGPHASLNNMNRNAIMMSTNGNMYTSMITLRSVDITNAGQYRCDATVNPKMHNMFVIGQGTNRSGINIALCEFMIKLNFHATNPILLNCLLS